MSRNPIPLTLIETAARSARRFLKRPLILGVIQPQPDGSFDTAFSFQNASRAHVEAIAIDLLRLTLEEIPEDDPCDACRARRDRIANALATLAGDHPGTCH